jgi:hypothetical protein
MSYALIGNREGENDTDTDFDPDSEEKKERNANQENSANPTSSLLAIV